MNPTDPIDAGRLSLALHDLRLPAIKLVWPDLAVRADKEGWPAARFLAALAEHEIAERANRRIQRHLEEARLPPGKTLDSFDFEAVPMISKAQIMALAAGDSWLEKGANLLAFGPPGTGKSHLAAALGLALIENGWRVLFTRTTDLVQKLQAARRDLQLEAAIAKLDKYHLLILDDIAYVTKDQAETSVIFELIAARYERRSLFITSNQPFGEWNRIFADQVMTLAAVDRLVNHATLFEMNVESYRRRTAIERNRRPGRPPTRATITPHRDCRATPENRPPPSRATTIIRLSRYQSLILIVAPLPPRLSRYTGGHVRKGKRGMRRTVTGDFKVRSIEEIGSLDQDIDMGVIRVSAVLLRKRGSRNSLVRVSVVRDGCKEKSRISI